MNDFIICRSKVNKVLKGSRLMVVLDMHMIDGDYIDPLGRFIPITRSGQSIYVISEISNNGRCSGTAIPITIVQIFRSEYLFVKLEQKKSGLVSSSRSACARAASDSIVSARGALRKPLTYRMPSLKHTYYFGYYVFKL